MSFCTKQTIYYLFFYFSIVFSYFLVHSADVEASEINFRPTLTVSETYTDNVRLGGGLIAGGGGFGASGASGSDR